MVLSLELLAGPLEVLPAVVLRLELTAPDDAFCVLLFRTNAKLVLSTVELLVVVEVTVFLDCEPVVSIEPVLLLLLPALPPAADELLASATLACSELELLAAPLVVIPLVVVLSFDVTLPLLAPCGLLLTSPTPFKFLTCEVFDVVELTVFWEL